MKFLYLLAICACMMFAAGCGDDSNPVGSNESNNNIDNPDGGNGDNNTEITGVGSEEPNNTVSTARSIMCNYEGGFEEVHYMGVLGIQRCGLV